MLRPLRDRVLSQEWARSLITFPFAAVSDLEPIGYLGPAGQVFDTPTPGLNPQHLHRGTDYGLSAGTPVTVALAGHVTYAAWSPYGYGLLVAIEGSRYKARYAHLSQIDAKAGTWALPGSKLGLSGATGNVTGPHLHFEVFDKVLQAYIDPLKDMRQPA